MSTHEVKVVKIDAIFPHTNSDNLEIVQIWGYQVVVRRNQFPVGSLAAYIESDYTVPLDRNEFKFLDDGKGKSRQRITMRRFRGEPSYGLLIPAPEGSVEGDNIMEQLGVERYEPPAPKNSKMLTGIQVTGPDIPVPHYDLENFRRFGGSMHRAGSTMNADKIRSEVLEKLLAAGIVELFDEGQ